VWLSPKNAKKQMEAIKDAFVKADPENKNIMKKILKTMSKSLTILTENTEKNWRSIQKGYCCGHQAYGYLCKEYGLRQYAIEGLNAESEPTPARMAEIVKFIKENDIKVIFRKNC